MDFERFAGALMQAVLAAVWLTVIALTARVYFKTTRPKPKADATLISPETPIKRSFVTFTFAFMPALVAWLPALGWMPSTDQLYFPIVLTWLVLLVFGTLQFHLNLLPAKAALIAVVSMEGGGATKPSVPSEVSSSAHPRRNV